MKNDEGKKSSKKHGYLGHPATRNHIGSGAIARPYDPTVERLVQRKFFWHNHYSKQANSITEKVTGKRSDFLTHPAKQSHFYASANPSTEKMSGKKVHYCEHPSKIDHVGALFSIVSL